VLDNPHPLLCYDGSNHATEAIDFAGALFPRGTRRAGARAHSHATS
jgi:hypothetical protein